MTTRPRATADAKPLAAEKYGQPRERRGEGAVEVREVAVRHLAVRDPDPGDEVVAGVAVEVAPRAPDEREQPQGEDGETAERQRVGRDGDAEPLGPGADRDGRGGHAATASPRAARSRSRIPGTTRFVTPIVACPLEISG